VLRFFRGLNQRAMGGQIRMSGKSSNSVGGGLVGRAGMDAAGGRPAAPDPLSEEYISPQVTVTIGGHNFIRRVYLTAGDGNYWGT
jgi:hypothetical protein